MKEPYCSRCDSLARDSSSKIVGAETNMGRVDIASSGGGHSVGESTVDRSVRVASIASVQESRVSLSLTLTKVVSVVAISIRSIALGRGVKSLGDGVKTSAGAEGDAVVSSVEESGGSLGLSLTLAKVVDIAISSSTGDRDVSSVDTGGTLETIQTSIPEDVDDDDALDMFADSLDDKSVGKGLPEASANGSKNGSSTVIKNGNAEAISGKKEIVLDEIMWEFKWEDTEESEIHGPHTSDKMHQWQESGFFDKGVFARKVGGGGEFNTSKSRDFSTKVFSPGKL